MSILNPTPEELAALGGPPSPEMFKELWPFMSKKDQKKWAKYAPVIERLFAPSAEEIELEGPESWAKRFFPQTFSRDFTSYQREFWEWGWGIQPDTYYRPRVECEPRGR